MPRITLDGQVWRYRAAGRTHPDRPPLLLVHGAAGGQYVWHALIRALGPAHRILAPDLPGHGGSLPLAGPHGLEAFADGLHALAAALGAPRYVPVGHSMGGAIALHLALRHPDAVPALVLVSTGARLPVSEIVMTAVRESFGELSGLMARAACAPDAPAEIVERLARGPIQASAAVVEADFLACAAHDLVTRLPEVRAPTLVIHGEADGLVGVGRARQLVAGLPSARLLTLPGVGHLPMEERPAALAEAIEFWRVLGTVLTN
jgi:pimeloyl-ACP methyl ester carboxylesterase